MYDATGTSETSSGPRTYKFVQYENLTELSRDYPRATVVEVFNRWLRETARTTALRQHKLEHAAASREKEQENK